MPHVLRKAAACRQAILGAVLIAVSCICPRLVSAADETVPLGETAPPFTLPAEGGTKYALEASLKNRPVLVAFLSAPCKPCEESIPDLLDVCQLHAADANLEIAAIALKGTEKLKLLVGDGSTGCLFSFLEEVTVEERFLTADDYGVIATPTFFLVAQDGKVRWKHIGRLRAAKADAEIRKALGP